MREEGTGASKVEACSVPTWTHPYLVPVPPGLGQPSFGCRCHSAWATNGTEKVQKSNLRKAWGPGEFGEKKEVKAQACPARTGVGGALGIKPQEAIL